MEWWELDAACRLTNMGQVVREEVCEEMMKHMEEMERAYQVPHPHPQPPALLSALRVRIEAADLRSLEVMFAVDSRVDV